MRKIKPLLLVLIFGAAVWFIVQRLFALTVTAGETRLFQIQSIDTMKYSRDVAREKADVPEYDKEIETEIKNIASTGATHVAVGTPYDKEFIPFLTRWVKTARRYKLNVWFRGNLSGWEGWFDYPKISPEEHTKKTVEFILSNSWLFENGDIFSSCPECENGGDGDPRKTGNVEAYRAFIIREYEAVSGAFDRIGKKVRTNTYSMNGDVARLIMDTTTTSALGSVVTIDHYVKSPETLADDITLIAGNSGGLVLLGEFGAPIPDIHGDLTDEEQAQWIGSSLKRLSKLPQVLGINYWTNKGSSTALWNDDNSPKLAVSTLTDYFKPYVLYGTIRDELGVPVHGVQVSTNFEKVSSENGTYRIFLVDGNQVAFKKSSYISVSKTVVRDSKDSKRVNITMIPEHPSSFYKFLVSIINFMR